MKKETIEQLNKYKEDIENHIKLSTKNGACIVNADVNNNLIVVNALLELSEKLDSYKAIVRRLVERDYGDNK